MKQIKKRLDTLSQSYANRKNSYDDVNSIIIYPQDDIDGKKATEEFYKKYPGYDGVIFLLPEIDKLEED